MTKLYLDENVDGAITKGLRRRGVDVLTVQDDNRSGATDPDVFGRAHELDRVLFTQDDDLLVLAAECQDEGSPFCGVIYAHKRRVTIGRCVEDLELIVKVLDAEELRDRVTYLPL